MLVIVGMPGGSYVWNNYGGKPEKTPSERYQRERVNADLPGRGVAGGQDLMSFVVK